MGIGSVRSPSEGDSEAERVHSDEGTAVDKTLTASVQNTRDPFGNLSGAFGGSRGYGSASFAEVLNRKAQLEVPAACASQGVIERL